MKKYFMLFIVFLIGLSGCTAQHYIETRDDSFVFYLQAPEAKTVRFASSYDEFSLHDARQIDSDAWQATVPLSKELKYFYIVDGSVYLPDCRFRETDDFGSENCLYVP
jgi:hypothetical protein